MPDIKKGLMVQKKKKKTIQKLEKSKSNSNLIIEYLNTICVLNTSCSNEECIEECQLKVAGWVND